MTDQKQIEELEAQIDRELRAYREAKAKIDEVKAEHGAALQVAKERLLELMPKYQQVAGGNYQDDAGYVQIKQRTRIIYDAGELASRWFSDPIKFWFIGEAVQFDSRRLDEYIDEHNWLLEFRAEEPGEPFVAVK